MVLSMMTTNISMAVMFVVQPYQGGPHIKVTSSEHTR